MDSSDAGITLIIIRLTKLSNVGYPYKVKLNRDEVIELMKLGKKNVQDLTIDKS